MGWILRQRLKSKEFKIRLNFWILRCAQYDKEVINITSGTLKKPLEFENFLNYLKNLKFLEFFKFDLNFLKTLRFKHLCAVLCLDEFAMPLHALLRHKARFAKRPQAEFTMLITLCQAHKAQAPPLSKALR